jgi:hypothetical protein
LFTRKLSEVPPPVTSLAHLAVWKTVRFLPCESAKEYASMLKAGKRKGPTEILTILEQIPMRTEEATLDLFLVWVSTLGFSNAGAHYDEILAKATELGFAGCPADAALQLGREYADQPRRHQARVVAPPVVLRNAPYIWNLVHEPPGQYWLRMETALPMAHFGPHTAFVFTRA